MAMPLEQEEERSACVDGDSNGRHDRVVQLQGACTMTAIAPR
jgi:hypothetical protein